MKPRATPATDARSNDSNRKSPKGKEANLNPSTPSSYRVWRVEYVGEPNHEAIFVETHHNGQGSGTLYHVVGTILQGMTYEARPARAPEQSATYAGRKHYLGVVQTANSGRINGICALVRPPGRQVRLNGKRIDPSKPLYRCGEWATDAIRELRRAGVLE